MKKILLVMKFWTDGLPDSTRLRNTKFTWPKLKEFSVFLKKNDIDCEAKLYDFSPEKIIEDSIHIPYELGEYKKSEKTNVILKENNEFDFVFMFDSDAFFRVDDYEKVLEILKNLSDREIFTFDLAKLEDKNLNIILETGDVDYEKNEWSYAYSGDRVRGPLCCGHKGNLGGVYLCDIKLIMENGGFDERYVGWGGEDGDMMGRIAYSGKPYRHESVGAFAPFHLPHFYDLSNEKYNKRFID